MITLERIVLMFISFNHEKVRIDFKTITLFMKKENCVLIGSSMSLPRLWDKITFEDTYFYKLQNKFDSKFTFYNRARRSNTTLKQSEKLNLHDDILSLHPKLCIMQIGISDCAPRLFSYTEGKIIDRLPKTIQKKVIKFFSKRRLFFTKNFPKVYVKPDVFKTSTHKIFETLKNCNSHLIVLSIVYPNAYTLNRSYNFKENIDIYNSHLKEIASLYNFTFIDLNEVLDSETDLLPDGFHLNVEGNQKVYNTLEKVFENYISNYLNAPSYISEETNQDC